MQKDSLDLVEQTFVQQVGNKSRQVHIMLYRIP